MTKLATRSNKLSGVLAHEYAPEFGYCRKTATVTVEAGMDIGAALVLVSGKYVWIEQADVASLGDEVAVLIEGGAGKDVKSLAAGDHQLTVLYRGPAGIVDAGLKYKNTLNASEQAAVEAKFEAVGITVRTGV